MLWLRLFGGAGSGGGGGGGGGGTIGGEITHARLFHTSFGGTPSSTDLDWLVGAPEHRYTAIMSDAGSPYKTRNPAVQHLPYTVHWTCLYDGADNILDYFPQLATDWATANGRNVEHLFLHAQAGQQNAKAPIASIGTDGTVALGLAAGGHQATTGRWVDSQSVVHETTYQTGDTVTVSGNSNAALNGTWTVQAVTDTTHLVLNTTAGQTGTGGSLAKTGDGSLNAGNRLMFFKFDNWRYTMNVGHVDAQDFMVYRVAQIVDPAQDDGIFMDESATGDLTTTALTSVEYGSAGQAQYITDLSNLYTRYHTAYPTYLFVPNTSDYQKAGDQQMITAAQAAHLENLNSPFVYSIEVNWNWIDTLLAAGAVHLEFMDQQKFDQQTPLAGISGMPTAFINAGGHLYSTPDDRCVLWEYASYLMVCDTGLGVAKKVLWGPSATSASSSPQSAKWRTAFEYPLGQPAGPRALYASGTDGAGITAKVFRRDFSTDGGTTVHATVLLRRGYTSASIFDATTAFPVTLPTPPAGTSWHMLQADGTLGPSITGTLDFWHVDVVILIAQ